MRWLLALVFVATAVTVWWQGRDVAAPPPVERLERSAEERGEAAHMRGPQAARATSTSTATPTPTPTPTPTDSAGLPFSADENDDARAPATRIAVRDHRDTAVASARVVAFAGERDLASAVSDAAGIAELAQQPTGTRFRVRARGYLPFEGTVSGDDVQRVALAPAPRLRGRVFDQSGAPVAGAVVMLLRPFPGRRAAPSHVPPHTHVAQSADDGAFALPWPDTRPHDLVVTASGFAPAVVAAITPRDPPAERIVTLQPAARLVGQLLDAAGGAVGGAIVEIWSAPAAGAVAAPGLGVRKPYRGGVPLGNTRTAVDGAFACSDLPAGGAWVVHRSEAKFVVLEPGVETPVHLRLPAPAMIAGTASASAGAVVFLRGDDVRRTGVGLDGRFAFADVAPGRYLVGIAREPFAEHVHTVMQQFVLEGRSPHALVVDVFAGEQRELDLAPVQAATGSVAGHAFMAGLPAAGRVVVVEPEHGPRTLRRQATVQADGSFRADGVQPGRYLVRLTGGAGGASVGEVRCDVFAGDTALVTVEER